MEIRPRFNCNQCGFKTTSDIVLKQHVNLNHTKNGCSKTDNNKKKIVVSKRKKCEYCEKQFNKEETYKKHMKTSHKVTT